MILKLLGNAVTLNSAEMRGRGDAEKMNLLRMNATEYDTYSSGGKGDKLLLVY
jgi:hypothetical protein